MGASSERQTESGKHLFRLGISSFKSRVIRLGIGKVKGMKDAWETETLTLIEEILTCKVHSKGIHSCIEY